MLRSLYDDGLTTRRDWQRIVRLSAQSLNDLHWWAELRGSRKELVAVRRHSRPSCRCWWGATCCCARTTRRWSSRSACYARAAQAGERHRRLCVTAGVLGRLPARSARFEALQSAWGRCMVNAFASPTTALLPWYWATAPITTNMVSRSAAMHELRKLGNVIADYGSISSRSTPSVGSGGAS